MSLLLSPGIYPKIVYLAQFSTAELGGEGLVTFLEYPPDDLVLVTRIQWLGE
jgi:hypothetical protein